MTIQSVSPSDKLKFRYIAAYLAEGLQAPVGGPRVYYSNEARGKKVYLTSRTDEIWNHIDTAQTISYVILTSLFHGKQWDPTEFTNHRSERAQKRLQQYGDNSAFLVLEASHEEEASRIGTIAESEERDFCLALPEWISGRGGNEAQNLFGTSTILFVFRDAKCERSPIGSQLYRRKSSKRKTVVCPDWIDERTTNLIRPHTHGEAADGPQAVDFSFRALG